MGILTAREIFSVTLEELNNIAGDAGLYCHALFIRCLSSCGRNVFDDVDVQYMGIDASRSVTALSNPQEPISISQSLGLYCRCIRCFL